MRKTYLIIISAVLMLALAAAFLAGCNSNGESNGETTEGEAKTVTITDLAGRQVEITTPTEKVTAIGPGALRLVCYVGADDQVVGIEAMEKQWGTGRPYILANLDLLDLPVIGQGGPDTAPDPEALLSVEPDVIFAAYLLDASKADQLQAQTGIPVVVLSYGELGTFDDALMTSIALIGRITGNEKRADEVVEYIKGCQEDLDQRTADIAADEKPMVYAGAIGMKGTHGIESTQASFPPLLAVNARNVVDEAELKGWSIMIDKEQLLQ
ncbi:MAG: ABC transporter substrate-binding protein, partial [Anaerolineae bacterium]|nr:ABC transporter substrate-binding protein [Anaerolineae bacterium]